MEHIRARVPERPPGYLQDVLSRGKVDGEWFELPDKAFRVLVDKYATAPVTLPPGEAGALYASRRAICEACEFWTPGKIGRCQKCNCSGVMLWRPEKKCPIGKW